MEEAKVRTGRAFRPGTVANNESHVLLYTAFTIYFDFSAFPASIAGLRCFGEFLLRSFAATKSVLNALSSVRKFHFDYRLSVEAFEAVEMVRWRRALHLTVRSLPGGAKPLPFSLLERLCRAARGFGPEGEVMAGFLAVGFHALARASTLLACDRGIYDVSRLPVVADAQRTSVGFLLTIKWDKTHQATHQAFQVPLLLRGASATCPVRALESLLQGARGAPTSAPLFAVYGSGHRHALAIPLTITRARWWLSQLLQSLGLPGDAFSLHSLRKGGCTSAFAGGADVSDLQALGGWRSGAVHLYHARVDAGLRAAAALRAATSR